MYQHTGDKETKMRSRRILAIIPIALTLIVSLPAWAHPTGNMITVGEKVLWSYINPVDDSNHRACIMIWGKGSEPKVFIQSEFPASDYMLYTKQNEIYIIERRHLQATQSFEVRILKTTLESKPKVIWDWFKDEWRIGEGGFFMISDDQIVFGRYPEVYSLKKGGKPSMYFEFDQAVNRIRAIEDHQILLLGNNSCYLVRHDGTILKQWDNLLDREIKDPPLNRNQIFDVDYDNGKLLMAYWGKRSFVFVAKSGKRQTILQHTEPLVPHWVAFFGKEKLLFSSRLVFDGSTPKPHLVLFKEKNQNGIIWNIQ